MVPSSVLTQVERDKEQQRVLKVSHKLTGIFHRSEQRQFVKEESPRQSVVSEVKLQEKPNKYCTFFNTTLSQSLFKFKLLTKEQILTWIRLNQRC